MSNKSPKTGGSQGIVADGQARARRAAERRIRQEVTAKYGELLSRAGLFRRIAIRIRIERDVRKLLRQVAPNDAFYGVQAGPNQ